MFISYAAERYIIAKSRQQELRTETAGHRQAESIRLRRSTIGKAEPRHRFAIELP